MKVIENAVAGHITVAEATRLLSLGTRQVKRLKQRCVPGEVDSGQGVEVGRRKVRGLQRFAFYGEVAGSGRAGVEPGDGAADFARSWTGVAAKAPGAAVLVAAGATTA